MCDAMAPAYELFINSKAVELEWSNIKIQKEKIIRQPFKIKI